MADANEERELDALRGGDEAAFLAIVGRYHAKLLRLALHHVASPSVAEEVVQETWLAVLRGLPEFEARSSFRTWLYRILTNSAKKRGRREARCVPFSALAREEEESAEPAVEPERFLSDEHPRWPGHWVSSPEAWGEGLLQSMEMMALVQQAIEKLKPAQREVIRLRDVEGLSAEEVCEVLSISQGNQRVLLHRARSAVRASVERHFAMEAKPICACAVAEVRT